MYFLRSRHIAANDVALDTDLRDLTIVTLSSGSYLYGVSAQGGGLLAYQLRPDGELAQLNDTQYFTPALAGVAGGFVEAVTIDGTEHLVFGSTGSDLLLSYALSDQGTIGSLLRSDGPQAPADVTDVAVTDLGGNLMTYLADAESGRIYGYRSNADGEFVLQTQARLTRAPGAEEPIILETTTVAGTHFFNRNRSGRTGYRQLSSRRQWQPEPSERIWRSRRVGYPNSY